MFDIGFLELLVIAAVGLVVIGPKRLPEVVRKISLWMGRLRRAMGNVKQIVEQEFQLDDVRRQLHNEEIMHKLEASKQELENTLSSHQPVPDVATDHDYEPLPRDDRPGPDNTLNASESPDHER